MTITAKEPGFDLPLARAIIEQHRGVVYVHETDAGAVGFGFTLPALDSDWTQGGKR